MLTGKTLGAAIAQAIDKKIESGAVKSKAEIARSFGIKPPSIHDWIKKGSISKDKLEKLWAYFSDVVGPEHWGMLAFPDEAHKARSSAAIASDTTGFQIGLTATPAKQKQHHWPFTGASADRLGAVLQQLGPADKVVAVRDLEYQLEIVMAKWERIAKEKKKEKSA